MRHKPKFTYKGLTLVFSNPSRRDTTMLASGFAGIFLNEECLNPDINRWQCDLRTSDTISEGLLPGTKVIVLFGDRALHTWSIGYGDYEVQEQRGCPLKNQWDLLMLCTFNPQDCCDMVNWEAKLNPLAKQEIENDTEQDDSDESTKKKGVTKRSNYRFWFKEDIQKAKNLLLDSKHYFFEESKFHFYPSSREIINILRERKNESLYIDLETDSERNIRCLGMSFDYKEIYIVPFFNYLYQSTYHNLASILQALAISFRDNEVVAHNGALFDLIILAWKYKIFPRKIYDTMYAHHRAFVDVEKSLGHMMSHLLFEPYHKDTGIYDPQTQKQEETLWQYCGYDVRGLALSKMQLDRIAQKNEGINQSIRQSNNCIRGDLLLTFQGIRYDEKKKQEILKENDRLMTWYLKVISMLTDGIEVLPTSNKSTTKYFYELLNYKIIGKRSEKTNKPSLDETNMWKLKLRNPDNPVIDLCLLFRKLSKESGMLKFEPWQLNVTS